MLPMPGAQMAVSLGLVQQSAVVAHLSPSGWQPEGCWQMSEPFWPIKGPQEREQQFLLQPIPLQTVPDWTQPPTPLTPLSAQRPALQ